ncbi:hypothetical protein BKP37_08545 [Anaerobacillus alkalilacustris]|uniref:Group-specific protein n=1 Tax=Anaerobacillus alkalilacustris TaxID=393763 RepID=A0A1S2LSN4_9BACI|nr:hypothetical protein [Anaerobacillus alkalilacustris]OIJ14385.1 hypothetical protein BKP37_08545 [Anaerobacillus alkalilacustris]
MVRKTLLIFLLTLHITPIVNAEEKTIEIFDIEKDQITKTVPLHIDIQDEAKKIVEGIDDVFRKFKPIPASGFMVKIPLAPAIKVENKWLNHLIDEVIIIMPKDEEAYLLIFDEENRPYFFTIKTSINLFLTNLNLTK